MSIFPLLGNRFLNLIQQGDCQRVNAILLPLVFLLGLLMLAMASLLPTLSGLNMLLVLRVGVIPFRVLLGNIDEMTILVLKPPTVIRKIDILCLTLFMTLFNIWESLPTLFGIGHPNSISIPALNPLTEPLPHVKLPRRAMVVTVTTVRVVTRAHGPRGRVLVCGVAAAVMV